MEVGAVWTEKELPIRKATWARLAQIGVGRNALAKQQFVDGQTGIEHPVDDQDIRELPHAMFPPITAGTDKLNGLNLQTFSKHCRTLKFHVILISSQLTSVSASQDGIADFACCTNVKSKSALLQ
jgi:hypothetical protein